jgi:uncharacterized protein DUF1203
MTAHTDFAVSALPIERFQHLIGLPDAALAEQGVCRVIAGDGYFPCRVTLEDAAPGQSLLLVNYEHQTAKTPYRSNYAIFVNEDARETRRLAVNEAPPVLRRRPIALRAYDTDGMLVGAQLAVADDVARQARGMLADPGVAYLHAHNAAHGCYAARIDRA